VHADRNRCVASNQYGVQPYNTDSSPELRERYSWISLPDSEYFDDDMRHEQSMQSSTVGSVSRPKSRILGQYEPVSRIDTSPHAIHEQETLLDTSYDRTGPPGTLLNAVDECDSLDQQCIRTPDNTQKREPCAEYFYLLS
jgi:hypothetical protein